MGLCRALVLLVGLIGLVAQAEPIKAPHLQPGDTVGLVSSAFRIQSNQDLQFARERLEAMGLSVVVGKSVLQQDGYFAGNDKARAQDINNMFANPKVKAIVELRGGWGSARILPYLNYDIIKQNPKIIIGYSDITALLLAIHSHTGLVTFHGPMAALPWPQLTANYFKNVTFQPKKMSFVNPEITGDDLTQTVDRIYTITSGVAEGEIVGGNLSVLTSLIGSGDLPDMHGKILFVEDVDEDVFRIDRMLTQLQAAGVLSQIKGFIFGTCVDCTANVPYGSYRLRDVLLQHIKPLGIPAWSGSLIGHQDNMFTIPEGVKVRIDADKGEISMLESAVL